jgi:hypothetical protein
MSNLNDKIAALPELANKLDTLMVELGADLDPEVREGERAEQMKDFDAEDGRWKFAPKEERDKVAARIKAKQDVRAAERLYAIGRTVLDHEEEIASLIERTKEPPTALESWMREHGKNTYSLDDEHHVLMLDELASTRIENRLRDAPPSVVLAEYQRAVDAGDTRTVRLVEQMHGQGWTGRGNSDPKEATSALLLHRRIKAVRDDRVPEPVRRAASTIARANKLMQRVKDVHRLAPRNPNHFPR